MTFSRGALYRSMSPNFNVPNIKVLNINVIHINRELLKFRAYWLYQKLCRSEVQSILALPKALQI
jgi:hypothetical protein